MTPHEIREKIAISLDTNCDAIWHEILTNITTPPFKVDDIKFEIELNDINVDNNNITSFTFKNGTLSGTALFGSSSDEVEKPFKRVLSGTGKFDVVSGEVKISKFQINEELDLFGNK